MESLSIGIPVIASDAGGTKEIIDNTVGVLLKNNFKPQELSSAIEDYYYLNNEQKNQIRKSAINRYEERCNMEKLTMDFISILRN
jgi:glycosyltransferase involved in cell wall biosynthesis